MPKAGGELAPTEAVLPELRGQAGITVDDTPLALEFDGEGRLLAFWGLGVAFRP